MKKKKLILEELKVKSFVTRLNDDLQDTVRAGEDLGPKPQNADLFCSWAASACGGRGCGSYPSLPGWHCRKDDEIPVDV